MIKKRFAKNKKKINNIIIIYKKNNIVKKLGKFINSNITKKVK